MTRMIRTLCYGTVVRLALMSTAQASLASSYSEHSVAAKTPLRLMPLGASITYGIQSSHGNGYRQFLYNLLAKDGYSVDMVGSREHGSMKENHVEGWPGFRIEQVQKKAELAVPSRLPNLFTINAGTNDAFQNYYVSDAGKRMEALLDYLWQASPKTTVVLSTLVLNLNSTVETRVERINEQIRNIVSEQARDGKRIVLAEMHGADGPQKGDMASDGTHPVDSGYEKMAKIWYKSIRTAEEDGLLQNPQPLPT